MKNVLLCFIFLGITMSVFSQEVSLDTLEKYNGWCLQSGIRVVNIAGFENGILDQIPENSPIRIIHIIKGDFVYQIMIGRNEDVMPHNIGIFTIDRIKAFIESKQQMIVSEDDY